jgi:hypothetical protein
MVKKARDIKKKVSLFSIPIGNIHAFRRPLVSYKNLLDAHLVYKPGISN